jgi:hypothetical protein
MIDLVVHNFFRILSAVDFDSIKIRLRERECVSDQFHSRFCVIRDDDFYDVEAEENIGMIEHAQPCQSPARNAFLFLSIDGRKRTAEILARARLHFYEYERVVIAADDVDLAAAASFEVAIENLVTVTPQEPTRQFLAVRAAPEMN